MVFDFSKALQLLIKYGKTTFPSFYFTLDEELDPSLVVVTALGHLAFTKDSLADKVLDYFKDVSRIKLDEGVDLYQAPTAYALDGDTLKMPDPQQQMLLDAYRTGSLRGALDCD